MTDTLKALDDLGELLDQLAGNAREFDFHATNRMERDAAKALLAIEAAVNALPELLAKVKRLEEALAILDAAAEFDGEPDDKKLFVAMRVADLRRARAALNQEAKP